MAHTKEDYAAAAEHFQEDYEMYGQDDLEPFKEEAAHALRYHFELLDALERLFKYSGSSEAEKVARLVEHQDAVYGAVRTALAKATEDHPCKTS